jgi:hypothetical protein
MPRTQNKGQGKRGQPPRKGQGGDQKRGKPTGTTLPPYLAGPRTPKELGRETRASTNQKFRPLEKAVAGDLRASERRVKDEGNWWQNYLNTVNAGQADTTAAYQQAGATNQAQIAQASSIDTANTAHLQDEAAKSAELRGVAPTTAPAERESAMQAQRNYLAAAQGGAIAEMGANQRAYLNEQKRIGVGQSIASRREEQRRGRSIRQDMRDVRKERGEYATAKRGEGIDKERDYLVQRRAFGLDKRKQTAAELEGAADRTIAQQNADSSTRSSKASAKNAATTAKGAAKGGKTPAEQREAQEGRQNASAKASQLIKAHGYPKSDKEWAQLEEAVAKEAEVSPADAARIIKRLKAKRANSPAGVAGSVENATPHWP